MEGVTGGATVNNVRVCTLTPPTHKPPLSIYHLCPCINTWLPPLLERKLPLSLRLSIAFYPQTDGQIFNHL